jgi:hypothetical protein
LKEWLDDENFVVPTCRSQNPTCWQIFLWFWSCFDCVNNKLFSSLASDFSND